MIRVTRRVLLVAGLIAIVITASGIGLTIGLRAIVKRGVTTILEDRFASKVSITDMQVFVFPRVMVTAKGVVLRYKGRTDVPPLITIRQLTLTGSLVGFLRSPRRVAGLHLEGLEIRVPPRVQSGPRASEKATKAPMSPVVIDEVIADDALLETLSNEAGRPPRDFAIHHVDLRSFGFDRPAAFRATLTNPKPAGEIYSEGEFGPWQRDDPGATPVQGTFRFSDADLGTLRGVTGRLSSTGKFGGALDHLDVEGDTQTPDFTLRVSGNPVTLTTHYVAVVDGTTGTTELKSVTAQFRHSTISSSGVVAHTRFVKGQHVTIDATSGDARIEDLLRLAVKGDPPMRGVVYLRAHLDLPPGAGEVLDRLRLDGQFGILGARLTDPQTQSKIDALSRRGQGEPGNEDIRDVMSNVRGQIVLRGGTATLVNLAFDVPGAAVQLSGSYNLRTEELDFRGHLVLTAKLSQATTGVKSFFLKIFDPFFRKNGATSLPIKITGSRSRPSFGLDLGRKD